MTPKQLKAKLSKAKTPAARSISNEMPSTGQLTTWKDKDGVSWVQVDNGPKRYKAGLPSYNEDAKSI
jgi:hypothetical protein